MNLETLEILNLLLQVSVYVHMYILVPLKSVRTIGNYTMYWWYSGGLHLWATRVLYVSVHTHIHRS